MIDFYCPEIKLAIEADGDTHNSEKEDHYDKKRQKEIEKYRITFLRFGNEEIFANIESLIKKN